MTQRELRRAPVIQNDIGYVLHFLMARNGDGRHGRDSVHRGIDGDEAFHTAGSEKLRVGLLELDVMPVGDYQQEIVVCAEMRFDSAQHASAVSISEFLGNNADRKCAT